MLRNKTKRSATMIGRITALIMIPASSSGSVFEFDEDGIATSKPAINYMQRERMNASRKGAALKITPIETHPVLPSPVAYKIPSEAITYVGFPIPKSKRHEPVQSLTTGPNASLWSDAATAAAGTHHIPQRVFLALINAESGFDQSAISPKGAIGLTQLMPATAKSLGVDPHDPQENLSGGARYLRQQYDRFGSWPLALAAYNAGPTRVARLGRIPNISETKAFVARVMRDAGLASSPITTASN